VTAPTKSRPRHPAAGPPAYQWSDLAKHAREVRHTLDRDGTVEINVGGTPYVLAPRTAPTILDITRQLCDLVAAVVAVGDDDLVRAVLNKAWAWTRVLPTDDQVELAREAAATAELCESLNTWAPLAELLMEWRATPVQIANPERIVLGRPG
jgi:hypothetical protein